MPNLAVTGDRTQTPLCLNPGAAAVRGGCRLRRPSPGRAPTGPPAHVRMARGPSRSVSVSWVPDGRPNRRVESPRSFPGLRSEDLVPGTLGAPVMLTRRPRTRTLTRPEADGDTGVPGTFGYPSGYPGMCPLAWGRTRTAQAGGWSPPAVSRTSASNSDLSVTVGGLVPGTVSGSGSSCHPHRTMLPHPPGG